MVFFKKPRWWKIYLYVHVDMYMSGWVPVWRGVWAFVRYFWCGFATIGVREVAGCDPPNWPWPWPLVLFVDLAAIPSVFLWVRPHPPLNQMINYSVKWLVTANVGIWSVGVWFANCSAGLCHGEFGFATYPFGDHVTSLMFSSRLYLDFFFTLVCP